MTSSKRLPPSELTDEQLLADFRKGDRAALVAIVERHETRLARIAYRITGCRFEAEDSRHAVFVRFLQSIAGAVGIESVGGWLIRCTVNEAVTRVRRRSCEGRAMIDRAQSVHGPDESSPLQHVEEHESRVQLSAALAQLAPDDRTLVSLRFDEGLTFREIAEVVDRPVSTVKSRVQQAIARLRELLAPSR